MELRSSVRRGDGLVFEADRAAGEEQGGRVYFASEVKANFVDVARQVQKIAHPWHHRERRRRFTDRRTLHAYGGFRFAVYPRRGGRSPELEDPKVARHSPGEQVHGLPDPLLCEC